MALMASAYLYLSVWYSPSIDGRVVDATTGLPVVSAVVVASWTITGYEGFPVRELAVRETVTNSNGDFEIDAWGPRSNFGYGHLGAEQPLVRIAADGYIPAIFDNRPENDVIPGLAKSIVLARFDGEVVRLSRAEPDDPAYVSALQQLARSMDFAYRANDCEWRVVPRMLVKLHRAKERGEDAGHGNFLSLVEHVGGRERCGNPTEFFREFMR
jgi:hypothetical protein